MSVDKKSLCPNCGAPLSGLEIKCPECGYVLISENTASQNTTESILSLQNKLIEVDKIYRIGSSSKRKASIIQSFPIPNTVESLIRLLHFSFSNFEAAKESGDKKLSMAWLGKALESYRRLSESKNDQVVAAALEQYSILGDKRAFSRLSGSRKKKRIILFSVLAFLAIIIAFVLWIDWAGYLMKRGKVDAVINVLSFTGRKEQAIDLLLENGLFKQAAEMLSSNGRIYDAVALLAQKGNLIDALKLTAMNNSSDSIHLCVDEIEKHSVLNLREKFYPDDHLRVLKEKKAETYDDCRFRVKRIVDPKDTSIVIWEDAWKINERFVFPEPQLYSYSPFQEIYRRYSHWGECPSPHIEYNRLGKVTYINLGREQEISRNIEFFFSYSTDGLHPYREVVRFDGIPFYELEYEYEETGSSLKRVRRHFILEDYEEYFRFRMSKEQAEEMINEVRERRSEIINTAKAMDLYHLSSTEYYKYEDGRLTEISISQDFGENHERIDRVLYKQYYHFYDNLIIGETVRVDPLTGGESYSTPTQFYFKCDGVIIEDFTIGLKDNGAQNDGFTISFNEENPNNSDDSGSKTESDISNKDEKTAASSANRPKQESKTIESDNASVTAPNWVQTNENFNVSFVFNETEAVTDFNFPIPDGIEIVWGPQKGSSTTISIVDGKRMRQVTSSYTFVLSGKAPGMYSLSAKANLQGQSIQTPLIRIEVVQ